MERLLLFIVKLLIYREEGIRIVNEYLPHLIGVTSIMVGFILAKIAGRKNNFTEDGSIRSRWIAAHIYKTGH